MSESDWLLFLAQASDRDLQTVGQLSRTLTEFIGAETSVVQIERSYVVKLIEKHAISTSMLPLMKLAIEAGYAYSDREHHLTFLLLLREDPGGSVKLLLKVTRNKQQILVCTVFKLRTSEFRRLLKRASQIGLLQLHK